MFRFFRRDNLRSTRRRSASCPNLEQASLEDETQEKNTQDNKSFESSSDSGEDDCTNKFERLKAQRSIRRVWLKEKEKKENTEKKLISMDDYLGKLSELKTWLKEERKKDVDNMSSPKLKVHFKTFVKLWNKRKLPGKYYRSCSVDLDSEDTAYPSYSDMPKQPINSQYSQVGDSSTTILPPPFDLSSEELLSDIGSPFSTFGKSGDLLTSPAILAEQVNIATPLIKQKVKNRKESSPQKYNKCHQDRSSPVGSPPKFATISRSIPAMSRLYKFTAQPWTSSADVKVHPIQGPKGSGVNIVAPSSFSSSPSVSSTFVNNFVSGEHMHKADAKQQTSSFTKSTGSSPVYSQIMDAIPYSTGSPKYAEIDEKILIPPQRPPPSGYCSLSPLQEWRTPYKDVKKAVSKRQSLSRRRSKSLEYLYADPFRADHSDNAKHHLDKEDIEMQTPPIPERKYSPVALFSTYSDLRGEKSPAITSPSSKTTCSLLSSPHEISPQKRQSPEGTEAVHLNLGSIKKVKSNTAIQGDLSEDSMLNTQENEDASSPLSILTGSLNPTTRSKYKLYESLKCSETDSAKSSEPRLSILNIKQLDESPKLPRRRMKRRSSSLSTTPGKGLTFGKASKTLASPRRVSFAKHVKETENETVPRKSISSRRRVTPNFTKQTQDRKEFESFMSLHESPPKKSNSPNKVPSPDKSPSVKASSPIKQNSPQKYLNDNVTPLFKLNNECQNDMQRKIILVSRGIEDKSSFSQLSNNSLSNTISTDMIFPVSSTRQVGRRVIGAPRASPIKNGDSATQILSPKINPTQTSHQVLSPEKNSESTSNNIFFYQKNIDDTSVSLSSENNSGAKINLPSSQTLGSMHQLRSPQKNLRVSSQLMSPQKKLAATSQAVSPQKNPGATSQLISPQKNPGATPQLISPQKNPGATSQLISPQKNPGATSQLISPQKNSGATSQLISPQKNPGATSQLISSQKKIGGMSKLVSPQKHLGATSQVVSPQKNPSATSQFISSQKSIRYASCTATFQNNARTASQNLSSQKHLVANSPYEHHGSTPESDSQLKDLTFHSTAKKFLDQPSSVSPSKKSINSLVAKLTEKTAAICAKELNESDDGLSSEEILNVTSLPSTAKAIDPKSHFYTNFPDVYSQSQELHKENEDFELTVLESSPSSSTKEGNCIPTSINSCTEILTVEEPDASLHLILKKSSPELTPVVDSETPSLVSHIFVGENSLQTLDEMSNVQSTQKISKFDLLPAREIYNIINDNGEANSTFTELNSKVMHTEGFELKDKHFHMRKKSSKTLQCVPLPVIDLAVENKKGFNLKHDWKVISNQDKVCDRSGTLKGVSNIEYEKYKTDTKISDVKTKEYQTRDNSLLQKLDSPDMDLISKHSTTDSISSASADKNESHCELKRLASIRASPKIVDNDGWITERRRSSRGKNLQSFRSAYNRYLLKSSSKDDNEMENYHPSEEKSLDLTTSFVDADMGKNISLHLNENTQNVLSQNLNEIASEDLLPSEKSESCYKMSAASVAGKCHKTDQMSAASVEGKCIVSPVKAKPPTFPKPSKTSLLMNRKLNAADNFVINTCKNTSKRRSLTGRKSTTTMPKEQVKSSEIFAGNYKLSNGVSTGKAKSSKRLSSGKDEVSKMVPSGRYKSSTRKSNEQDECLKSNEQVNFEGKSQNIPVPNYIQKSTDGTHRDSNKFTPSTQGWSRSQKSGQTARKRSSNGGGDSSGGRRRSKGKNMDEENKTPSFAERRNFFRQLHTERQSVKIPKNHTVGINYQVRYSPQKLNQQLMTKSTKENIGTEL